MRVGPFILASAVWLTLALPGGAQNEPREFAGSQACGACHQVQAAAHSQSAHALSLARPSKHRLAEQFRAAAPRRRAPAFSYRWRLEQDQFVFVAADGEQSAETVVDWAFGAGDQAVTFVSRIDEDWYLEHYLSYYASSDAFEATPGHQNSSASNLEEALGVKYRTFSPKTEIMRCFRCHSTGPLSLGDGDAIRPSELGVRCEACHGPGSAHAASVSAGRVEEARRLIVNPASLSPEDLLLHCGNCHRPPSSDPAEIDYNDPWNVRHQPLYLGRSACFSQSSALTCMNCHDPHERVRRNDPSHYRAQCTSCHSTENNPVAAACGDPSTTDCTACHMPRVKPHRSLAFTNHWIGVFEDATLLTPRR